MCDSSSDRFALEVSRRRIAGLCSALGWHSASPSSLDLLADLLRLQVARMGRAMREAAEACGRTRPDLRDARSAGGLLLVGLLLLRSFLF